MRNSRPSVCVSRQVNRPLAGAVHAHQLVRTPVDAGSPGSTLATVWILTACAAEDSPGISSAVAKKLTPASTSSTGCHVKVNGSPASLLASRAATATRYTPPCRARMYASTLGWPETSRRSDTASPSKTMTVLSRVVVLNAKSPSRGAVQRYQTVAAADPNHSPSSMPAPALSPSLLPCAPDILVALSKSSFSGRPCDQCKVPWAFSGGVEMRMCSRWPASAKNAAAPASPCANRSKSAKRSPPKTSIAWPDGKPRVPNRYKPAAGARHKYQSEWTTS